MNETSTKRKYFIGASILFLGFKACFTEYLKDYDRNHEIVKYLGDIKIDKNSVFRLIRAAKTEDEKQSLWNTYGKEKFSEMPSFLMLKVR